MCGICENCLLICVCVMCERWAHKCVHFETSESDRHLCFLTHTPPRHRCRRGEALQRDSEGGHHGIQFSSRMNEDIRTAVSSPSVSICKKRRAPHAEFIQQICAYWMLSVRCGSAPFVRYVPYRVGAVCWLAVDRERPQSTGALPRSCSI